MDVCPAFWEWLVAAKETGKVFSIEQVADEIDRGDDELADWAKERGDGFFLPLDTQTLPALSTIAEWVQGQQYTHAAVNTFLESADYYLIAYALSHGHTVVTHEKPESSKKKVKIPNVCIAVNVKFANTFSMLRTEHARFVLASSSPL